MERSFPNLNGDTSFVNIRRELELQRSFEIHQLKEKRSLFRSIFGRGPASGKEQPFPVVMVTRIALDSMDEVTRKKKPFHSRKNELHSCSTDRERSRFYLGEPTTCLPSRFAMYLRRLKSFFTALFTIGRAVDRPLYRCVYRGDRMCGCGDTTISSRRPSQKLVCTNSVRH